MNPKREAWDGRMDDDAVTLKEFFLEKLRALEQTTEIARSGMEKATELARSMMEKRLDTMNEFREALKDQASRGVTRIEHDALVQRIDSDIRILRESKAKLEGKADQITVNVTLGISLLGLVISIVGMILRFGGKP